MSYQIRICHEAWHSYAGVIFDIHTDLSVAKREMAAITKAELVKLSHELGLNPLPNEIFLTRGDDPSLAAGADDGNYEILAERYLP